MRSHWFSHVSHQIHLPLVDAPAWWAASPRKPCPQEDFNRKPSTEERVYGSIDDQVAVASGSIHGINLRAHYEAETNFSLLALIGITCVHWQIWIGSPKQIKKTSIGLWYEILWDWLVYWITRLGVSNLQKNTYLTSQDKKLLGFENENCSEQKSSYTSSVHRVASHFRLLRLWNILQTQHRGSAESTLVLRGRQELRR